MASREGSLEAPTRHPIDWKSPEYWDEEAAFKELERIFDICHGCRRCVSLCNSFPTLFDLVDEGKTGEVDGVDRNDYWKVVDHCYLCDLCYMTKCPYVPPHEWNLDFPHTMLRAKAIKFRKGGIDAGSKLLASTDVHGQLAGIPVVTQVVNAVNQTKPARAALESTLHVDRHAWLPSLATRKFKSAAPKSADVAVKDGERTPGKVAVYSTCYVNYNEPGIGLDLLKILEHNDIPYVVVSKEKCCGMPKLELGDLDSVDAGKRANIPVLAKLAREGWAIVSPVPSCTLMFKQEIPLMYPGDADVQAVKEAMWDPFEYLAARRRDGLLKTDFSVSLGKVSYQVPCHQRVQNIGRKTEEVLKMVPGTQVHTNERCSGHAGTYGVKKETHAVAMKIGRTWGYYKCPASHPYLIPQEENKVQWTVTADMIAADRTSRIHLSSDDMLPGAKPGETLHADYMEAWIGSVKAMWVNNCIEKALDCSGGDLGNGKQLIGAAQPSYGWVNLKPRVLLSAIAGSR